jgi:hypothetical protein
MKRLAVALVGLVPSVALADPASIGVGGTYARPPVVVVADGEPSIYSDAHRELPKDPYRSPFRLTVGPAAVTSGQGIGPGLLAALDLGTGAVGVRLSAAWFGGEQPGNPAARLGSSVGLYAGEMVLDLHKEGPLHALFGIGLGALDVGIQGTNAWAAAGLARIGFEYALTLEEADVRFGAALLGGLIGPADSAINARAFATMMATVSIGF